jgi:hypothetical protein
MHIWFHTRISSSLFSHSQKLTFLGKIFWHFLPRKNGVFWTKKIPDEWG